MSFASLHAACLARARRSVSRLAAVARHAAKVLQGGTARFADGVAARTTISRHHVGPLAGAVCLVLLTAAFVSISPEPVPAYRLAAVRDGRAAVPRAFVERLPVATLREAPAAERKRLFVRTILPLILRANESIARQRARLREIVAARRSGKALTRRARAALARLAERYGAGAEDIEVLERRIDVIPASLALAQAAVESGWGTSRFAARGNALYGVYAWEGGLVPRARPEGARHAIRSYPNLAHSIRAYMHTLNTHPAYRRLRETRRALRLRGERLDGRKLVGGLARYSVKGEAYTGLLVKVIARDRLDHFDRARLARR